MKSPNAVCHTIYGKKVGGSSFSSPLGIVGVLDTQLRRSRCRTHAPKRMQLSKRFFEVAHIYIYIGRTVVPAVVCLVHKHKCAENVYFCF